MKTLKELKEKATAFEICRNEVLQYEVKLQFDDVEVRVGYGVGQFGFETGARVSYYVNDRFAASEYLRRPIDWQGLTHNPKEWGNAAEIEAKLESIRQEILKQYSEA